MSAQQGIDVLSASLAYKTRIVLNQAKLRVNPGEVAGILGPNGAGKSSFFDLLCGLKPQAILKTRNEFDPNSCIYFSQSITTPPALKMYEIAEMIELMSGDRDVDAMRTRRGYLIGQHKAKRFAEIGRLRSGVCSYGEKRWYIAMCLLAIERHVYILDEPTNGVDPEYRVYIWRAIHALKERRKTILVSSHLVSEIAENCDLFYFLSNGAFTRYENGRSFMDAFGCDSLDTAFISAAEAGEIQGE